VHLCLQRVKDKIITKLTRLEISREDWASESSPECEVDSTTPIASDTSSSVRKGKGKAKSLKRSLKLRLQRLLLARKDYSQNPLGKIQVPLPTKPSADRNQAEKLQKEVKEVKEMISKCET